MNSGGLGGWELFSFFVTAIINYEPKILTALSAIPTKPPGITPRRSTLMQQIARAKRSAHVDGTLSSEAGAPSHITLTTLK